MLRSRGEFGGGALRRLSRRRLLSAAGLALLGGASGCGRRHPRISYNVRLSFDVATEAERLVSTGVWGVSLQAVSTFPNPGTAVHSRIIGQAIPVNVGGGQNVFAMLVYGGQGSYQPRISELLSWEPDIVLQRAYGVTLAWSGDDSPALRRFLDRPPSEPAKVPPDLLPALVAFDDPRNAATGKLVDPEDISTKSGSARLLSMSIQVVSNDITTGLERLLPWVSGNNDTQERQPFSDDLFYHQNYFIAR